MERYCEAKGKMLPIVRSLFGLGLKKCMSSL
jgi:hypothetical protein